MLVYLLQSVSTVRQSHDVVSQQISVFQELRDVPRSHAEHPQIPPQGFILSRHLPQLHDNHRQGEWGGQGGSLRVVGIVAIVAVVTLATIELTDFCHLASYLKTLRIKYTKLYICLFSLNVKLGLSHWGRNLVLRQICAPKGGRRKDAQSYVMKKSVMLTFLNIIRMIKSRRLRWRITQQPSRLAQVATI